MAVRGASAGLEACALQEVGGARRSERVWNSGEMIVEAMACCFWWDSDADPQTEVK